MMSDSGRKVIHTDVDTGLSVVQDSGDEQEDEVGYCQQLLSNHYYKIHESTPQLFLITGFVFSKIKFS